MHGKCLLQLFAWMISECQHQRNSGQFRSSFFLVCALTIDRELFFFLLLLNFELFRWVKIFFPLSFVRLCFLSLSSIVLPFEHVVDRFVPSHFVSMRSEISSTPLPHYFRGYCPLPVCLLDTQQHRCVWDTPSCFAETICVRIKWKKNQTGILTYTSIFHGKLISATSAFPEKVKEKKHIYTENTNRGLYRSIHIG